MCSLQDLVGNFMPIDEKRPHQTIVGDDQRPHQMHRDMWPDFTARVSAAEEFTVPTLSALGSVLIDRGIDPRAILAIETPAPAMVSAAANCRFRVLYEAADPGSDAFHPR